MSDRMGPHNLAGIGVALAGSTVERVSGKIVRTPLPVEDLTRTATLAEEMGYTTVWVPDHGVWDPFVLLSAFAHRTRRLALATGVVTVPGRSVEAAAAAASTLDRVSGGRAVVGVGSGPVRDIDRVERYVGELRDGLPESVPIYLAALGPRMIRAAGRVADGIVLNWCTPERVRRVRHELADVEGPSPGIPRRRVSVAVYVRACLGHDERHAREALGEAVGMYASFPNYRRQLEREGLGDAAAEAVEAHRSGRDEAIPGALLDALCIRGGREDAVARLEQYRAAGADHVVVYPVTAQEPLSSLIGTIMAAAPDPAVEA
jgi:alkanesulfonate monooxygenase SsuD/methylene tetrahydromethanopterin reductase-like flavin-dependent oxidoreductase (luciferase family)